MRTNGPRFPRPAIAALLLLLAAFVAPAQSEQLTVGQPGLATIQAAIDAALSNDDLEDVVLVPAASYDESVAIVLTDTNAQRKLTLRRKGKDGEVRINGQGGAPAIRIDGPDGVVLRNLVVSSGNSADGVAALEIAGTSRNVDAKNVHGVPGDDVGVLLGPTTVGVRLAGSDFSGMLGVGFLVDGASHTLDDCRASACGLNGIVLLPTSLNCVVDGAEALSAATPASVPSGVISVAGTGHVLKDCVAGSAGSEGDGFFVEGAGHLLTKCVSDGNSRAGFNVNAAVTRLQGCRASSNLFGAQGGGQGAVFSGGRYDGNSSHGILLLGPGTSVVGISAEGNVGNGVFVPEGVVGSRIEDCTFEQNIEEGVTVSGSFTWLEGNLGRQGDGFVDLGTHNSGRDNVTKGGGVNDF